MTQFYYLHFQSVETYHNQNNTEIIYIHYEC